MRRLDKRKLIVIIAFSVLTSGFVTHLLSVDVRPVFSSPNVNELRFAVITDIHFGDTAPTPPYSEEVQMLEIISTYHPDFIVDCGDWIYNDHVKWDDAQDYFVTHTNTTIFNVMGNHDDQAYYQTDRDDLYPVFGAPDWMDEATGGTDCYAYLRNNILFIFLSSGSFSNHQISVRFRRFVEYLVAEKFNTQTFMIFCHNGMNATVGHEVGESPLYKSGYWVPLKHGSRISFQTTEAGVSESSWDTHIILFWKRNNRLSDMECVIFQ